MAKRTRLQKINNTTFKAMADEEQLEVIVGDEKQKQFFPRVKLKKWQNKANFSIGTKQTTGMQTVEGDVISFTSGQETARFYPIVPEEPSFDTNSIRILKLGGISPERIGSIYELDRHVFWPRQTIVTHHCDRYAMMYYGFYPAEAYVDINKLDLPEMRISAYPTQNDPMVMDDTLKLIDVHYNPRRDDLDKIHSATKTAIQTVLQKYGITTTGDRKLYFEHSGKQVKFFSTAFIGGHYYYYINMGLDYQQAHQYLRSDITPPTKDTAAYGLRAVDPNLPDTIIDEIVEEYSRLYGVPLDFSTFTSEENAVLEKLDIEHRLASWVRNAERDIFDVTAKGFDEMGEGFEFEIELKQKPADNVLSLSVETKGLNFYYQDLLDSEESRTHLRPPNTIGSFAAYYEENVTGEEFKTGKAFHIYRPWAVDATGTKVWCAFDHTWTGQGDLTITVPQSFLDTATYPVIVDPTFGYTSQGASAGTTEGIYAVPATSVAGTLSYIAMYGISTTTGKAALYDGSTKVVDSNENTSSPSGAVWYQFPVSTSISAQSYNIAFWLKAGGYNGIKYDTVTNAGLFSATTYVAGNNGFPASVTFSTDNNKYSIYGSYTVSGSGGLRVWSGTEWQFKPVKVWDGSSWTQKTPKRWDGSTWKTIDS